MKRLVMLRNISLRQPVKVPPGHVRVHVIATQFTFNEYEGPQRIPANYYDIVPKDKAELMIRVGFAEPAVDEFVHASRGKIFDVYDEDALTLLAEGAAEEAA